MKLYIIPNIKQVSGGPRARILSFAREFKRNNYEVIEHDFWSKLNSIRKVKRGEKVYVETASNRIKLIDFICLSLIRLKTDKIIFYIRDIYIELLPNEYKSMRQRVTRLFNKLSTRFYVKIGYQLAFPTENMGMVFFTLNPKYVKKKHFALPPGCFVTSQEQEKKYSYHPKPGIVYMGGINYNNSGIENYLNFILTYESKYRFYILTQDKRINDLLKEKEIDGVSVENIEFDLLPSFFEQQSISFAFHARNRSDYDDLTFPIKILDFISMLIPCISAPHKPLVSLLGSSYPMFTNINDFKSIDEMIMKYNNEKSYLELINLLRKTREQNLYKRRIEALESIT